MIFAITDWNKWREKDTFYKIKEDKRVNVVLFQIMLKKYFRNYWFKWFTIHYM